MKNTQLTVRCGTCGKEFKRKKSHAKTINYCSVPCANEGKKKAALTRMSELVGRDFKEWLKVEYTDKQRPIRDIARELYKNDKCSSSVLGWLEKFGIETRDRSEAVRLQWVDNEERRQRQADFIRNKITGETREKIIEKMQTDEYKEKQRIRKTGELNGMYGVTGPNNPRWNPERTHEQRAQERKTGKDKAWRLAVFERDKFTCQFCGDARGGNLVAHHINSYSKHKELRHDPSNGITLCEVCHKDYHSAYGWKNATAEKFKLFMQKTMIA